jgi:hypothetical protein
MRSMSMRIVLCSLALSFGAHTLAQGHAASGPRESARVVFVCEHGSIKSLIAMAYFSRSAQEQGLAYRAVARETAPQPIVPDFARGRNEIVRHVDALLDELARRASP